MKKENLVPLNDNVVYEIVIEDRKTEAGLFLPGQEDFEAPIVGKVIISSAGLLSYSLKRGDKIIVPRGVSTKVPLSSVNRNEAVYIVGAKHILCKVPTE